LLAAAPAIAAQAVWTVDDSGGADFAVLQHAIDAAADGDAIVVEPGVYAPIRIDGKGLRLHARLDAATIFNAPVAGVDEEAVVIANLAAGQAVVLDGLSVQSFLAGSPSVVHVRDCAGPVWLQRTFVDAYGAPALHVEASTSVVLDQGLMQTNLTAPTDLGVPQPGPGALVESGSRLFAYDTDFRGSHGPFGFGGAPPVHGAQDGGHGLLIVDSEVHLSAGGAFGGAGSTFDDGACLQGGDGGSGAVLVGAGGAPPVLRFTGTLFQGSIGGFAEPCAPPPSAGVGIEPGPGAVADSLQAPRFAELKPGLRAPGEPLSIVVHGQAGDLFVVFATLGGMPALSVPTGVPLGALDLHVLPAPLVLLFTGVLTGPAFGAAVIAPPLPPGVLAVQPALQSFVLGANGFPHTCAPLGLTLVQP
jgi:hypothetical protein